MSFEFVRRYHALSTDDYWFELDEFRNEQGQQFMQAHIRFARVSPSIIKRVLHEWKILRQCVTVPLFAVPEVDDSRWRKFVALLGFRPLSDGDVLCVNGESRPIFIHTT